MTLWGLQDDILDRYSDIAYLVMFPHYSKWSQMVLLMTILFPINAAVFIFYGSLWKRDEDHKEEADKEAGGEEVRDEEANKDLN
jgi:hypothetical protein